MSIGVFVTGDEALVSLALIVQAAHVETVISVGDDRWRVVGWDQERQAFRCERVQEARP